MKRFNAAMQGVFFVVGFIGFLIMCCEPNQDDNWWKVLMTGFILFISGFVGCVFFDNPARYVRYIVGALVVVCAAIYSFFHELKEVFKILYNYKKRHRTYKNTYRSASDQYYRRNATYNNEGDIYIFGVEQAERVKHVGRTK